MNSDSNINNTNNMNMNMNNTNNMNMNNANNMNMNNANNMNINSLNNNLNVSNENVKMNINNKSENNSFDDSNNQNNFWDTMTEIENDNENEDKNVNIFKMDSKNTEDYYNLICDYRGSIFSLSWNIVVDLLGLFLAYRTFNRLPSGLTTYLFLFFYAIIVMVAIWEILLHLIWKKEKAKEMCKKYYQWLDNHKAINLLLIIVRWILFIVIFIFGFISAFTNLDYKNKTNSNRNTKFVSLYNNRNYQGANRNNNRSRFLNRNRNNRINNN